MKYNDVLFLVAIIALTIAAAIQFGSIGEYVTMWHDSIVELFLWRSRVAGWCTADIEIIKEAGRHGHGLVLPEDRVRGL